MQACNDRAVAAHSALVNGCASLKKHPSYKHQQRYTVAVCIIYHITSYYAWTLDTLRPADTYKPSLTAD